MDIEIPPPRRDRATDLEALVAMQSAELVRLRAAEGSGPELFMVSGVLLGLFTAGVFFGNAPPELLLLLPAGIAPALIVYGRGLKRAHHRAFLRQDEIHKFAMKTGLTRLLS